MEAFVVDLRYISIERDKFEIAQRYRHFRRLKPLRVRTQKLLEKIGDN